MAVHPAQPGDCFDSLAKENGFYNYKTLYDHPDNAGLKGTRPNPNQLAEGDNVNIPDKRPKKVALDLDKEKKFVVDRKKTKIRVKLVSSQDKMLAVTECTFTVGSFTKAGQPAEGLIEGEIDPKVKTGSLKFKPLILKKPTPPARNKPATAAPEFPPHPPKIVADEFTDEKPPEDTTPLEFEYELKVGSLEPHTEVRGSLQRLNNLGCKLKDPEAKTATDDETKVVIKSYQRFKGTADPSGNLDDVKGTLEAAHDKI
ncbi:MAG: hypothetical protein JST65_13390 [Acidobacteria bacterium]|nr:hypothetical protein [Acidobacteriota bacterium]